MSQPVAGDPQLTYRPDIDGLRAIAVLAVVVFHAGLGLLPGGYVGVDVFLVISGFLITSILLRDPRISTFYLRRARRILPALFVMLAVVLVAAVCLCLPADLVQAGQSLLATLTFASNFFFWTHSDYFKPDTEIMPLLHTWSLGLEEQFYIGFPLLVLLLRGRTMRARARVFALLAALSLAVAVVLVKASQGDTAFYMLPGRAWELLAGSVLATGVLPAARDRRVRDALGVAGLALLAWPMVAYGHETPFPGLAAIPPVLGATLLLAAGAGGPHLVGRLLGARPLVGVGLISYSLYLWHWPVLALLRYRLVREPRPAEAAAAIAGSLLLAWLSWRFVETPFRRRIPDRAVVRASLAGGGALAAGAVAVLLAGGLPGRFPAGVVALNDEAGDCWKCPLTRSVGYGEGRACPLTGGDDPLAAEVILWGDSNAEMYAPALMAAAGVRPTVLVCVYGCAPVVEDDVCGGRQARNFATVAASRAHTVILALNWPQYRYEVGLQAGRETLPAEEFRPVLARLERTVAALRAAGKRVFVVSPIPLPNYYVPSVISRELAFYGEPVHPTAITAAELRTSFASVFDALDRLGAEEGVEIIDMTSALCPGGTCAFFHDGRAVYSDYGHLAVGFARTLGPAFAPALAAAP